jgi:hypothetical protein
MSKTNKLEIIKFFCKQRDIDKIKDRSMMSEQEIEIIF